MVEETGKTEVKPEKKTRGRPKKKVEAPAPVAAAPVAPVDKPAAPEKSFSDGVMQGTEETLKALGIAPAKAKRMMLAEQKKTAEEMVEYDLGPVGVDVKINGKKMPRTGIAPINTVRCMQEMVGKHKMRLLSEALGTDHTLVARIGGGYEARVVRRIQAGE